MIFRVLIALLFLAYTRHPARCTVLAPTHVQVCRAAQRISLHPRLNFLRAFYEGDFEGFPTRAEDHDFLNMRTRPLPGRLFFEVENSVLKDLNDVLFAELGGQGMSQAAQNLYKRLFFNALNSDRVLAGLVEHRFSDYKGIRIVFREDSPEIRRRLSELHETVGRRFHDSLMQDFHLEGVLNSSRAHGVVRTPRHWWTAGMAGQQSPQANPNAGMLMDQASVAARIARRISGDGARILDINDPRVMRMIGEDLMTTETLRRQIQNQMLTQFGRTSGILVEASPGTWVLSAEALDIMRRARGQPDLASYLHYIQDRFRRRFDVALPAHFITGRRNERGQPEGGLQQYFHNLENYLVSLNVLHERSDGNSETPHNLIAIDFQSQGARIAQQVAAALAEGAQIGLPHTRPAPGSRQELENLRARTLLSIRRARTAVDRAADEFSEMRERAIRILRGLGIQGHPNFGIDGFQREGDELRFASARPLTLAHILEIGNQVAAAGLPMRTVDVNTRYFRSDNPVPQSVRTSLESLGMRLLKDLAELEGNRPQQGEIPADLFRQYRYLVRFTPFHDRPGGFVDLVLSGPVTPLGPQHLGLIEGRIRQYLQDQAPDFQFRRTVSPPNPLPSMN